MSDRPSPSALPPRLMTDAQVADMLALPSVQALRDMRSRGGGPPVVRLGTRVRYLPRDVMDYIAANRAAPTRTRKSKSSTGTTSEAGAGEEVSS